MPYEWVSEAPEQDADVALWCYRFSICDGGTGSELLMWNGRGIWFGWDKLKMDQKHSRANEAWTSGDVLPRSGGRLRVLQG